jgi:hypothetical protein
MCFYDIEKSPPTSLATQLTLAYLIIFTTIPSLLQVFGRLCIRLCTMTTQHTYQQKGHNAHIADFFLAQKKPIFFNVSVCLPRKNNFLTGNRDGC